MNIEVNGAEVFVDSGGCSFDPTLPAVLFLHGSGGDHRTWAAQTTWFALNGYTVIAPDLPGHSLSAGKPANSIEQSAQWLLTLLDIIGVSSAHLIGHSQGFLIALEFARHNPEKVRSLTGVATAATIPVNPALIETAIESASAAAAMMVKWGFGPQAQVGDSSSIGAQAMAESQATMQSNPLANDLQCCANYSRGEDALVSIVCPCAMILGALDKMTPMSAGQAVAERLGAELTVLAEHGHMLPMEAPQEVLAALRTFISKQP